MTKPPTDDKAMREARKVSEDYIKFCDYHGAVQMPEVLKESIAAHFRNYEIAMKVLGNENNRLYSRIESANQELKAEKRECCKARMNLQAMQQHRDRLDNAIRAFHTARGRHEGDHTLTYSDGTTGGTPCVLCDESYIKAEAELDKAIRPMSSGSRGLLQAGTSGIPKTRLLPER
jgi:hypothetical protein